MVLAVVLVVVVVANTTIVPVVQGGASLRCSPHTGGEWEMETPVVCAVISVGVYLGFCREVRQRLSEY